MSREITQAMIANKQIIYVDETTFHQWMVPARAWVKDNMSLKMPSSRGTSFSIVGAISERDGLVYAKIFKGSNDTSAFLEFVHELVQRIKGEALVYMDNYTVKPCEESQGDLQCTSGAEVLSSVQLCAEPYRETLEPAETEVEEENDLLPQWTQ